MRERDGEIDGIRGGDLDSYIRRCPISSDRGFPSVMVAPFWSSPVLAVGESAQIWAIPFRRLLDDQLAERLLLFAAHTGSFSCCSGHWQQGQGVPFFSGNVVRGTLWIFSTSRVGIGAIGVSPTECPRARRERRCSAATPPEVGRGAPSESSSSRPAGCVRSDSSDSGQKCVFLHRGSAEPDQVPAQCRMHGSRLHHILFYGVVGLRGSSSHCLLLD